MNGLKRTLPPGRVSLGSVGHVAARPTPFAPSGSAARLRSRQPPVNGPGSATCLRLITRARVSTLAGRCPRPIRIPDLPLDQIVVESLGLGAQQGTLALELIVGQAIVRPGPRVLVARRLARSGIL
jgi:hypothetical protein